MSENISLLSAGELVARYRDGDLSPVEAARAALARIEALKSEAKCLPAGRCGPRARGRPPLGGTLAHRGAKGAH